MELHLFVLQFFIFLKIFNYNISILPCNIVVSIYLYLNSAKLKIVCVSVSSIIFIISALIADIFYCLNYNSLLLHLITTHLVSHLSFSSIIFIISTLIIVILYDLNYTLLLLHVIITHLVIDFIITM